MEVNSEVLARFRSDLLAWGPKNIRAFPWRDEGTTPYEILVAELLLQQTRSSTVSRVLPDLLEEYPDIESLATSEPEDIASIIRPLGLYNERSRALHEIGRRLRDTGIPDGEEELLELPQVGRYVANATLCFGLGRASPIVDSNIKRVYSRLLGEEYNDKASTERLWNLAETVLPDDEAELFNLALLDFGATICTDSSPSCEDCFANSYCEFYSEKE